MKKKERKWSCISTKVNIYTAKERERERDDKEKTMIELLKHREDLQHNKEIFVSFCFQSTNKIKVYRYSP